MTPKEQQTLLESIKLLQEENKKFREDTLKIVEALKEKVENKFELPNLEKQIVDSIQVSLQKSITDSLSGYNSPLGKFATNVVNKYSQQIESIFSDDVGEVITTNEFKQKIRETLLLKITKTMLSGVDGSVEKIVNLMKQDMVFRSKLILVINNIVEEFLSQRP